MAGYQTKSNRNTRLAAVGFAIFLLVYIGSQLWGFANIKLRTEQVVDDTIYDFVRAEGMVFRSEEIIPQTSSGVTVYNYADGAEVAKEQEIAAVYKDKTVSMVNSQIEQFKKELSSLQKAQTVKATRYSAVINLSSQINDQAGRIVDFASDGVVEGISSRKEEMVSLLNRKQIALGEEDTFSDRISQLKSEIAYLEKAKKKEKGKSIEAPEAGYFCKEVDGYETVLKSEELKNITYEEYQQLVNSKPKSVGNTVGKIVKTHVWYMGADMENSQAQKFQEGDSVRLDFKFANGQTVAAKVTDIIPDKERNRSVVIFECKDITDRLLKVRSQSVDIIFTTYSGLRVSSKALYHEQNIPGVYVVDKTTIRFKPVEIIKDNGNFILCKAREGTDEAHTLQRLDSVILESGGIQLRDGNSLDEETVKGVNQVMQALNEQEVMQNVREIRQQIDEAAIAAGRNPKEVQLMAVTKTVDPVLVNAAIEAGITLLGENKAQELCAKYDSYHKDGVQIHFIGHLQTNKVKQIVDKVQMIESVDSIKLAREIEKQCAAIDKVMEVLLEVNIGREENKTGIFPEELPSLLEETAKMEHIKVRGLMTIPPVCENKEQLSQYFSQMNQLFIDIKQKKYDNINMEIMSMGMSGDYQTAIGHGSNIVRIGTAMFGQRNYKRS